MATATVGMAHTHLLPVHPPAGSFQPLIPLAAGASYSAAYAGPHSSRTASGYVYLLKDPSDLAASNGQLLYATEADPGNPVPLLAPSPFLAIDSMQVVGNFLVLTTWVDGLYQTDVMKLPDGDDVSPLQKPPVRLTLPNDKAILAEPILSFSSFPLVRVLAESFISPPAYYDFDLATMASALRAITPMDAAGHDHTLYTSERVYDVQSSLDKIPIPVSIVYK